MGKVSFGPEKVIENMVAFLDSVVKNKPASSKGIYIRSIGVSTTMGPGFKIDPVYVKDLLK